MRLSMRFLALLVSVALVLAGQTALAPAGQADWPGPGPQINSGNGDRPAIASIAGEPWVAYGEGPGGESAILVKRLVGGVWTAVGGPLSAAGVYAVQPAITEVDGAAYVAWTEQAAGGDAVRVARWSGTAWVAVGGSLLGAGAVADPSSVSITALGAAPAVPYVSHSEQSGGTGPYQVQVARFVSSAWQPVGGVLNTVPSRDATGALLATVAGSVLVAFDQDEDAAHTVKAHVATWTGSGWAALGGGLGADEGNNGARGLDELDGQPALLRLVAENGGDPPSLVLSRWTGSTWTAVGPVIGRTGYGGQAALTVSNGVPFVVWVYTSDIYYMTGARLAGTTWLSTGEVPHGGTFGIAEPSLADVGGAAHLVWWDWDGTGRLHHSQYASDGPEVWGRTWGGGVVSGDVALPEICTIPTQCQAGGDGDGAGGIFSYPRGVAVDGVGAVWVADEAAKRIQKFDAQGSFLLALGKDVGGSGVDVCTVSSQCHYGASGDLGGQFSSPAGIATDAAGHVFVVDDRRIQEFTSSGAFVRAFGRGVNGGDSFNVCTVAASCTRDLNASSGLGGEFNFPYTVAVDDANHVYVGDTFRVQKFAASPTVASDVAFLSTWGKDVIANGAGSTGFEVCTVASQCKDPASGQLGGELSSTQGLATHDGQVFVLDSAGNDRVQVFTPDGSFVRAWGQDVMANGAGSTGFEVCTVAASCQAGTASTQPGALDVVDESNDGISVGPDGDVLVADYGNNRVNVYETDGTYRHTFGSIGTLGGELTGPLSVEAGPGGEIAVLEKDNDRVSLFYAASSAGATYAFSSATYSHAESGSQTVTVTRSGDTSAPGSVHYATANGTAVAGSDYTAASGDLSFTAGQTSRTFDVPISADTVDEPDETVLLALSAPSAGDQLGTPSTATLTIVDDDVPAPPAVLDTVIDSGPTGETYVSTPSFSFHSTVAGSTFQCRVDGAAFAPCTVPYVAPVLATGPHSFEVRALAGAEVDATPAHRDFSIGGAQTISQDCSLSPYAVPRSSGETDLCRIGGHLVKCSGNYHCVPKDMDCPAGSRCTMTTTATWRDDDKAISWTVLARARHFADKNENNHETTCGTAGKGRCTVTVVDSGVVPLGAQPATADWANAVCYATPVKLKGASYGSAGDRRIDCHGVLEYEPSQAVQPLASGSTVQVLAPGAGTLTLSSSGAARVATRGKKPTFSTVTQSVGGGEVVTFTPKLAKKLKKKLKHGKKVKLTVYSTYRSPAGTVVRSSAKVTLQKAPKDQARRERTHRGGAAALALLSQIRAR